MSEAATEATEAKEYSAKVTKIVDLFTDLKVTELLELQEALEAKGIKPAAVAAVAGPAAGGGAAAEAEAEPSTLDVILKDCGPKKIQVIKKVREVTNLGLKEAKDLVESAPKAVKEGLSKEDAEKLKAELEEVGASVDLK